MKVKVTGGIFDHNDREYEKGDILDVSKETYEMYKFTLAKVKDQSKLTSGKSIIKSTATRSIGKK